MIASCIKVNASGQEASLRGDDREQGTENMRQALGTQVVLGLLQEVYGIVVTLRVIGVWRRRKFITQCEGC